MSTTPDRPDILSEKSCARCGSGKLIFAHEFHEEGEGATKPLFVSVRLQVGKIQMRVCGGCGHIELFTQEIAELVAKRGDIAASLKLIDHDFREAALNLGLVEENAGGGFTWEFFAHGTVEGVPMAVGERGKQRLFDGYWRRTGRVEVMAKTRADIGICVMRREKVLGPALDANYLNVIRLGDPEIDRQFRTVQPTFPSDASFEGVPAEPPTVQMPWLDETARRQLCATPRIQELNASGREVGLTLLDYEPSSFAAAVEIARQVARWPGPSTHAYR